MSNLQENTGDKHKLLYVGYWNIEIYEKALASGFAANGWSVIPFKYTDHLPINRMGYLQRRIKIGPAVRKMNDALFSLFQKEKPKAVLFRLSDLVFPSVLAGMKKTLPETQLVLFHNDNPFVGLRNRIKWRYFLKSIPIADLLFVFRPSNVMQAQRYGAKSVSILLPYYCTAIHMPLPPNEPSDCSDLIFIGHYADDGRIDLLDYLARNGVNVKVFGPGWLACAKKYPWLMANDVREVRGKDYARLLSSAKIALVLLSRANRDVYTIRCFEIPACGTFMIAPRTRELEGLFRDGVEAVYFDSVEDLLSRVRYYLEHNDEREKIASTGRRRCIEGGNSEIDRARQVIELIECKISLERKLNSWRQVLW